MESRGGWRDPTGMRQQDFRPNRGDFILGPASMVRGMAELYKARVAEMRWREDGNHAVFGFPTERKPRRDGARRDHGFDAAHPEQDEVADDGTIIPGTETMIRKLMGEST